MNNLRNLTLLLGAVGASFMMQASDFGAVNARILGEGYSGNCLETTVSFQSPVKTVCFEFGGHIEATANVRAAVLDGEQVLAESTGYRIDNAVIGDKLVGDLFLDFEGVCPPPGGVYTVRLSAGSVSSEDDSSLLNNESSFSFSVPANFGLSKDFFKSPNDIRIERYVSHSEALHSDLAGVWNNEGRLLGNPEWELYREGELIGKYPCLLSWDQDLTEVSPDFGERICFDDGVRYSLVLPAGSVCAINREDILSLETRIDFTGSYSETGESPKYCYCNAWLYDWDSIGEVVFTYDLPFDLETVADKKVLLYEESKDGTNIYEASPVLSEGYAWFLTADFGGVEIKDGNTYTITVPEGTVRKANGNSYLRPVQGEGSDGCRIKAQGNIVTVAGLASGSVVTLFSADGRVIGRTEGCCGSLDIELPEPGMFIITAGEKVFKVMN